MIHARTDYDRIQDPAVMMPELLTPGHLSIGIDEPVFLFRAKDKFFQRVLMAYAAMLEADPAVDRQMVQLTIDQMVRADEWQKKNGSKTPDL